MRCWSAALVGGAVAAAAVLVTPGGPVAASAPAQRAATVAVASDLDTDGVRDYWTADRMESALPLDLDLDGDPIPGTPPASGGPSARATAVATPRSAGKLFFRTPEGDAVCSAAAVNTAARNVIITAAHCVHSGAPKPCGLLGTSTCPGAYFTDFLFVPRYANGSGPDGSWVGTRAVTFRQWIDNENLAFDQALIEVGRRSGRELVDVVGGNGLAWNFPARQSGVSLWGWPAQAPYDGETAQRCAGSTSRFDGTADAGIECPLTGGASGGPWYLSMVNRNVGFIWAVTSRRTIGGTPTLIARPLTSAITNLLAAARARPVAGSTSGDGIGEPAGAEVAPASSDRVAARPGLLFRAVPARVGRGQLLRLRARTTAGTRIVLAVRYSARAPWERVRVARTGPDGVVEFRQRPTRVGLRYYRVRTATRTSDTVRVRVFRCPLPLDRTAAVVDATACSNPVS